MKQNARMYEGKENVARQRKQGQIRGATSTQQRKKKKKKHALPTRIVDLGESWLGFVGCDGFANRINFVYK